MRACAMLPTPSTRRNTTDVTGGWEVVGRRGACWSMNESWRGVGSSGWVGCPLPCRRELQTELARARFARLDL